MQHAYSYSNLLTGLAATAFTWSDGSTTDRSRLNDGKMNKVFGCSSSGTSKTLTIDFGSAQTLQAIAILNTNICRFGGTPTIEVRKSNDNFAANNVAVKAASSVSNFGTYGDTRAKDIVLQFASQSERYWRLLFSWSGSAILSIGELWAAVPTVLTRAMTYDNGLPEIIKRTSFESYSGETRHNYVAGPIRERVIPFRDLSSTERQEVMAMWRLTKGGSLPMLWIEQYEATATAASAETMECIFGTLQDPTAGLKNSDFGRFDPDDFRIRSFGREVGA